MEQLRTTSGTDPAGVVHRLYRALAVGDIDAAAATLTDDTVLHVPGTGINVGTWTGRAGVLDFVQKAAETTAGTLRLTLHRAFADDEWAVGLATYTATRPGREVVLENHLAHVMRLRGGLIAEGWLQARDQYAVDAFWAR
ncbi:nuclear transport factor 2 family protein [Nakamurella alba]|nr:nuclear transport factor 2 family protein [Nakamurella alba]